MNDSFDTIFEKTLFNKDDINNLPLSLFILLINNMKIDYKDKVINKLFLITL